MDILSASGSVGLFCLVSLLLAVSLDYASADTSTKNTTTPTPLPPLSSLECALDHDGHNPRLSICVKKGQKFLKRYIRALSLRDETYDFCHSDGHKFMSCVEPLLEDCPRMRHALHGHWRHIIEHYNCVCSPAKTQACQEAHQCLAEEYGATLVGRCDALYDFNVKQQTREQCHFLRENVNCKDALITSKCGQVAGTFAYHMLRLYHDDFIRTDGCHLPREPNYSGFRYTDNDGACGNFYSELKTCVRENISRNQILTFREDNDVIVKVKKQHKRKKTQREIEDACQRFQAYKECVQPIEASCPRGLSQVIDMDTELRKYIIKMEFICSQQHKADYINSSHCYNRIHDDGTLVQCYAKHLWRSIEANLSNVTAVSFYCHGQSKAVSALNDSLDKVVLCYESISTEKCGDRAGQLLSRFISLILQDPDYLTLDFRPDCDLHSESTAAPSSTVTPSFLAASPPSSPHVTSPTKAKQRRDHVSPADSQSQPGDLSHHATTLSDSSNSHSVPESSTRAQVMTQKPIIGSVFSGSQSAHQCGKFNLKFGLLLLTSLAYFVFDLVT